MSWHLSRAFVCGFFCSVLLCASPASARVFSFGKESFAAYLRGSYAAGKDNTAMTLSSGNNVTLDGAYTSITSAEIGFIHASRVVNTRFGIELLRPPDMKDRSGANAAGTSLYSVTSETQVLIPKVAVEVNLKAWQNHRLILNLAAGSASLTGRNSYVLTNPDGNNAFPGLTDHYEDLRGTAIMYEGSLGYEGLLSDTTTYMIEAGYRSLNFMEIKQNRDVTTFTGSVVKGDKALNMDGTDRNLKLTQIYFGISFRFWVY